MTTKLPFDLLRKIVNETSQEAKKLAISSNHYLMLSLCLYFNFDKNILQSKLSCLLKFPKTTVYGV